jgi:hypothetical protein
VFIPHSDGTGEPMNLWYSIDGTWQTITLDPAPCYGYNIACGPDGYLCILYQRRNAEFITELRMARGKVDKLTGLHDFVSEPIVSGQFTGFLEWFTTSLAVDSHGQPHIIYPTQAQGEQLWYSYRDAQGWAEPYLLDENSQTYIEVRYNAIALGPNDRPLCAFAREPYHLKAVWFQ